MKPVENYKSKEIYVGLYIYTAKIKEQHSYVESQAGRRKLMYVVFIDWYLSIPKPRLHSTPSRFQIQIFRR